MFLYTFVCILMVAIYLYVALGSLAFTIWVIGMSVRLWIINATPPRSTSVSAAGVLPTQPKSIFIHKRTTELSR